MKCSHVKKLKFDSAILDAIIINVSMGVNANPGLLEDIDEFMKQFVDNFETIEKQTDKIGLLKLETYTKCKGMSIIAYQDEIYIIFFR